MQLTSFRGVTFTTLGVVTPSFAAPESPSASRQAQVIDRIGADPIVTGIEVGARVMTVSFSPANAQTTEPTFAKILALLNPDDPIPATLVGSFLKTGPSTYVTVEATAICGGYRYSSVNTLLVDFIIQSPWREQSSTTLKTAGLVTADGSFTNLNTGFRDVLPVVTVYWDGTQRSSSTATFGWKHRIGTGETITNIGVEPLINQPYQIGPIDTATLVTATQMLASGNDLRVFYQGDELRRNVIAPNTKYTFLWVILPTVAPGQAITLDILTNNPTAGAPGELTIASGLFPGMDISGTSFNATSVTATVVTNTGAAWETNQWKGGTIIEPAGQMRRILSNTATTITVSAWSPVPAGTAQFVIIKSGLRGDGDVADSSTASTLTDAALSATDNEWIGATLHILTGTGAGQTRTVTSNVASTLNITPNWTTNPTAGATYRLYLRNSSLLWDVRVVTKAGPAFGLWVANRSVSPPSVVSFDHPGCWYRFTYARSRDSYSQPRADKVLIGGSNYDYFPVMRLRRARRGKAGAQTEVGIADAIGFSTPYNINTALFGYTIRSAKKAGSGTPGEGMCEAKFMVQESGGENWAPFLSDLAVHNTTDTVALATYDLTGYGSPNRIAVSLVPNASDEIPDQDNNTAELKFTDDYVQLVVDPSASITSSVDWVTATPAVVAVYDVDLFLRNGGAAATRPYERIRIGGVGNRVFIAATDERIVVDCETHLVTLTTDAGVFIRRIPYVLRAEEVVLDPDGVSQSLVSARWLPIVPSAIDAALIYYSDESAAGWGSVGLQVTGKLGYLT